MPVIGNTHHDTRIPHLADEYEITEESVVGFFDEPEDTECSVTEDCYFLDNEYSNEYGA